VKKQDPTINSNFQTKVRPWARHPKIGNRVGSFLFDETLRDLSFSRVLASFTSRKEIAFRPPSKFPSSQRLNWIFHIRRHL